ncbi:hypothetical protein CPB84DRAFT_1852229 [Gymnopilus junonius]|uniref:Uncharacterized protein n=1 Tax=Gymnopilus junonius TaxID=109634 RepID=A0A9P5NAT6_GYMJU|nr:hypothetical protein CPB84DRAFT_1852229 [Gymnopilus junonius]
MPLLWELNLTDIPGHSDLKSLDSESIILPHLINLHVLADFEFTAAITHAIKPAAPCSLYFNLTITQDSVNLADITALLAVVSVDKGKNLPYENCLVIVADTGVKD